MYLRDCLFLQAEDGIRYHCVTGVQTCALPIFHDDVTVFLARKQREEDAEPEIETVHHDIDEHRKGDDEGPEDRKIDGKAHRAPPPLTAPAAGVMPAARAGASLRGPCSP